MAYIMLQYDRPTDVQNWSRYNGRVRDWIALLVQAPGAVSFMAYRTTDGASPDTMALLEFRTLEEARAALAAPEVTGVLEELRALAVHPRVLLVERSPFTQEPIRPGAAGLA